MRAPMGRCRDLFAFPSANAASDPRPCPGGASGNVLCRRLCGQGAQRRLAGTDELTGRVSRRRRRLGARRCNCTMVRAWCERRAPHFLMEGRRSAQNERPPLAAAARLGATDAGTEHGPVDLACPQALHATSEEEGRQIRQVADSWRSPSTPAASLCGVRCGAFRPGGGAAKLTCSSATSRDVRGTL